MSDDGFASLCEPCQAIFSTSPKSGILHDGFGSFRLGVLEDCAVCTRLLHKSGHTLAELEKAILKPEYFSVTVVTCERESTVAKRLDIYCRYDCWREGEEGETMTTEKKHIAREEQHVLKLGISDPGKLVVSGKI